jgi:HAD superfamily hydrolase (TIGR01509 family)
MLILPRALLFDMDGTLTQPFLDFPRIKAEMGIGTRPILEALAEMDDQSRQTAEEILLRHECEAARSSTLNDGCQELLSWIQQQRIATALITRNSRASVETILERHGLLFDVLVTREDGRYKPDPQPLLRACQRLGVATDAAWMVGDGQHDVEAGLAADIRPIWVSHGQTRSFTAQPWHTVRDLIELTDLLKRCLDG